MDNFLNDMKKESEYYSKVIGTEFNKPFVRIKRDHEEFKNSTKCCDCKKVYEEGEVKVKDHVHITRKFCGSAHEECYLNLSLSKKILVVFHNFQNYKSHLIFKEVRKYNFKINVLPKAIEK